MLFFAVSTAAVVASPQAGLPAAPAPSATPLQEIGHVRSSAYCSTLAKHVAPALLALIKTDELIAAAHATLNSMSGDTVRGSTHRYDLDLAHLSQVITLATRNLQTVRKLLDDPYLPANLPAGEARSAADLRTSLEQVAAQQTAAINLMDGTYETARMAQMQEGFSPLQPGTSAVNKGGTPPPTSTPSNATPDPSQYLNAAGLPDRDINSQFSQKSLAAGSSLGRTSYDAMGQILQLQQTRIAAAEKPASDAVVAAVALCNASRGPTAPPVTPSPAR